MRAEEERSRLPESDLSPRDASFARFLLSFFLPHFSLPFSLLHNFLSLLPLSRKPSRLRLASDVFHQINSRSTREYALLSTPRRRVCIISFIIQLALNSTLFRGHDRSLRPHRPSSSFSLRSLLLYLAGHPAPPFTHAGCTSRMSLTLTVVSSFQRFRFPFSWRNPAVSGFVEPVSWFRLVCSEQAKPW